MPGGGRGGSGGASSSNSNLNLKVIIPVVLVSLVIIITVVLIILIRYMRRRHPEMKAYGDTTVADEEARTGIMQLTKKDEQRSENNA